MKLWPKDVQAVVCCRVDDPYLLVIPDSQKLRCFECDSEVWAAPTTFAYMQRRATVVACMQCYSKHFKASGAKVIRLDPPTPEQMAEIEEALKRQEP